MDWETVSQTRMWPWKREKSGAGGAEEFSGDS
jgi:hypothetical protein